MKNDSEHQSNGKKKHSKVLLTLTTIYGILYLIFVITSFFEGPYDFERIIVYLAFIIFLVGYYYSWRNEMIAGIVFILWWGIMWYLGLFIAEHDRGAGVVMGVPLFIIGILFIVSWYGKRGRSGNFNNVN
jgi:hypothetical protein